VAVGVHDAELELLGVAVEGAHEAGLGLEDILSGDEVISRSSAAAYPVICSQAAFVEVNPPPKSSEKTALGWYSNNAR
jgi:hypothetical protein